MLSRNSEEKEEEEEEAAEEEAETGSRFCRVLSHAFTSRTAGPSGAEDAAVVEEDEGEGERAVCSDTRARFSQAAEPGPWRCMYPQVSKVGSYMFFFESCGVKIISQFDNAHARMFLFLPPPRSCVRACSVFRLQALVVHVLTKTHLEGEQQVDPVPSLAHDCRCKVRKHVCTDVLAWVHVQQRARVFKVALEYCPAVVRGVVPACVF